MAKEVKKYIRIPKAMNEYIAILANFMNVSENDAIKMIIFNSINNTNFNVIKNKLMYDKAKYLEEAFSPIEK